MLEQKKELYRYSLDPFLLVNFFEDNFRPKMGRNYCFGDYCSGSGIIAFMLAKKYQEAMIDGFEIQEDLCSESERGNQGKHHNLQFHCGDLSAFKSFIKPNSYDVILSNPPYYKLDKGRLKKNPSHLLANHEVTITLSQLLQAVRYTLKPLGSFYCSYHPSRGDELLAELIKNDLKPMAMKAVHPDKETEAAILLVKSVFKGKNELAMLPPLFLDEVSKDDYR